MKCKYYYLFLLYLAIFPLFFLCIYHKVSCIIFSKRFSTFSTNNYFLTQKKNIPVSRNILFHLSIYITIWNTNTIKGIVTIAPSVVSTLIVLAYLESLSYT